MNCKPGDMAYVTGQVRGLNYGKVVSVLRHASVFEVKAALRAVGIEATIGTPAPAVWMVEPSLTARCTLTGKLAEMPYALDAFLRPIRDPGDDAVDESRAWLPPVPTTGEVWKPKRQVENA